MRPGPARTTTTVDDDGPAIPRRSPLTGLVALHGGGEYVAGDEPAMDALVAAGAAARAAAGDVGPLRVVLVPTAAAAIGRTSPRRHGRRAFEAAGARAGLAVEVEVAGVLDGRIRGGPRERGAPRGGPPGPPPRGRPGPAARRAARDARLGRDPAGTRRRRVRRGRERRGDGARRAAVDPRRTHRRAGPGARDRRAPPLRPGPRGRAGGASWIPTADSPGSDSTSGRSSSAARARRGGRGARAGPRDPAGRGVAGGAVGRRRARSLLAPLRRRATALRRPSPWARVAPWPHAPSIARRGSWSRTSRSSTTGRSGRARSPSWRRSGPGATAWSASRCASSTASSRATSTTPAATSPRSSARIRTGLAFVPNATTGVSTVLASLRFSPGDELLACDHEYNATLNALRAAAARDGATVVLVRVAVPDQRTRRRSWRRTSRR